MKENEVLIDTALQAADEIQTNIQTYVTDKLQTPQTSPAAAASADDVRLLNSDDDSDNSAPPRSPISPGVPLNSPNSLGPEFEFDFTSMDSQATQAW